MDDDYRFERLNDENITDLLLLYKDAFHEDRSILKIKAFFTSKVNLEECLLCVSIKSGDKDILFSVNNLQYFNINENWNGKEFIFNLPKISEKESTLAVVIWNRGKNTLNFDDFEIKVIQ